MDVRQLGQTDLRLSAVTLGTMTFGAECDELTETVLDDDERAACDGVWAQLPRQVDPEGDRR